MALQNSPQWFSRAFLSVGGGFVRIWRSGQGLSVELPTCVVVRTVDGSVVAVGHEAAQLEGKLPPGMKFIRPFWGERIIDRSLLREVLQEALDLDAQQQKNWLGRATRQCTLVMNETTPALHHRWLRKTCEELWPWPWKEAWALSASSQQWQKKQSHSRQMGTLPLQPMMVVDCGFSAVRGAVFIGEETLPFSHEESLGLEMICKEIVGFEEKKFGVLFAASLFFHQEWGVQQAALRAADQQPIMQPLHRESVTAVQKKANERFQKWIANALSTLPKEIRVALQHEGILLVGGAARFFAQDSQLEKHLGLPIRVEKTPLAFTSRLTEKKG